ncbi:hypothetical protein niasHT_015671 [Heterodera trifolii]|uniref:Rab-GAP TBC domain-containing protein n=1 Tax=Heterodera trifolii TaxID=157864 RepID=A0ABD2L4I4_9BILA
MANRFNDFLKKAHGAIAQLRGGGPNCFLGKNGEVIFSKNNVCVHESGAESANGGPVHSPGYLTIQCSEDDQLGITLILQWLPNTLLEKTPSSIRCVSPLRGRTKEWAEEQEEAGGGNKGGAQVTRFTCSNRSLTIESDDGESAVKSTDGAERRIHREQINGTTAKTEEEGQSQRRPQTLIGLSIPSICLIPNTPVEQQRTAAQHNIRYDQQSESSEPTSGEDGDEEEEDKFGSGTGDSLSSSEDDEQQEVAKTKSLDALRKNCAATLTHGVIPEQFAREHNLMLADESIEETEADGEGKGPTQQQKGQQRRSGGGRAPSSLFAVNLGKMRSMRVFYSDAERTSGQLVIASLDSQYKIFHFHHTGLDRLTELFERWNAVKAKSTIGNESPHTNGQERHLLISPGTELAMTELDPEDGLYERLGWEMWRSYVSADGSVEDGFTIRKTIHFSSIEPTLRKELWPFLLRVYPWNSTTEQRENIRNEMFVQYQKVKGQRMRKTKGETTHQKEKEKQQQMAGVEQSIVKDVLRTDRRNSFFAGEENPNLETMKSILLTYATKNPEIGYIQGMSDLLAPLLCTLQDEPLTYWCFVHLIEQTLFRPSNGGEQRSEMEVQLDFIRELLRLFVPDFHAHLAKLGGDAPGLMFVHRWILLFFKREFPSRDSLQIWEACWSRYRTNYFHLFIACAVVSIYGPDVVAQNLPHDEILFYFSSLSMHMDAHLILRKARGLLYQFHRLPRIPCTLAGLCSYESDSEQWTSHIEPHGQFECSQKHGENGEEQCPFAIGFI